MYKNRARIRVFLEQLAIGKLVCLNDISKGTGVYRQGILAHLTALKSDFVMRHYLIKRVSGLIILIKVGEYNKSTATFGASFKDFEL